MEKWEMDKIIKIKNRKKKERKKAKHLRVKQKTTNEFGRGTRPL